MTIENGRPADESGRLEKETAVYDLLEQFSHSGIDSITDKVCIQSFHYSQTRQDLSSHSSRVCHTGTSDGLYQSFLDNTFFYVQGQLTGTLLSTTPTYTVCQTGNVFDLL